MSTAASLQLFPGARSGEQIIASENECLRSDYRATESRGSLVFKMDSKKEFVLSPECRKSVLSAVMMLGMEEGIEPTYTPSRAPFPSSSCVVLASLSKELNVDAAAGARVEDYVERIVYRYSDVQFKSNFRMTRTSFQNLLELVAPYTKARTVSLEKRTLACLWYVSNTETFRSIADRFGMSKGSLHYYLRNFCNVMAGPMILPKLITWPKEYEYSKVANEFFVEVIGVIDGTYVPIPGPHAFREPYTCRKGFPAFHLQAVCDTNLKFLDVYSAYPGSVHDSRVFRNSPLCKYFDEDPPSCEYHLLGDSAYALSDHLLTPFRDEGYLSAEQKTYNAKHSSTRVCIERCFGLLIGKFRKLKYLDINNVSDIPTVIVTCCVLHNFIIENESVHYDEIYTDGNLANSEEVRQNTSAVSAVVKWDSIMHSLA